MQNSPPNSSALLRLQAIHQRQPLLFVRISFVVALILLGLSTYFYQSQFAGSFTGFYIFLLSLPFIRLSFPLIPLPMPHANIDTTQANNGIRWCWIGLSVSCMVVLTMMNIPHTWVQPWQKTLGLMNTSPHIQMILLCVSLLSLIHGFGKSLRPNRITWKQHHIILLGIVLLGGGIRLWNLEYTIHMFVDEFFFLSDVIALNTETPQILFPVETQYTDVYSYLQLIFVNLMGPSLTSLRIVTPIINMLGLVVIYSFVRQLFSIRVALMSAFLLSVLPVYIHFGRIGMNMVVDPILGMIGFLYFLRGLCHQQHSDFAIAGIAFGLTHYFYEGGRIFFTLFFACWLVWITVFNRRKHRFNSPTFKQLAVFVFCLGVVILPFYHTLWSNNHSLTQRLDATTHSPTLLMSGRLSDFLLNNEPGHLGAPLQRYVQTVAIDNFYQSNNAYLLPIIVPFFLLGFGILLWRIHTVHGALFIWWAAGVAIANSLIFDIYSAPSPRHVVVYGVLMIITALGIDTLWSIISAWVKDHRQRWVQTLFVFGLGCLGIVQVNYYFNTIVPNFHNLVFEKIDVNGKLRPAFDDMILRAVNLPSNTTVHVFTELLFSNNLKDDVPFFFGRRVDEFEVKATFVEELTDDYFKDLPHDRNHVFTFTQYHENIIQMIEQHFEITKIEGSPFDIPDDVEMKFYHVPIVDNP
jgi:hypothetical protein